MSSVGLDLLKRRSVVTFILILLTRLFHSLDARTLSQWFGKYQARAVPAMPRSQDRPTFKQNLYLVVQECLQNVMRHSSASSVELRC